MIDFPYLTEIASQNDAKILMLVIDGLGGLPHPDHNGSELQIADINNLDRLAGSSSCGLTIPVLPGISPGSGPGHLALFGYNPVKYLIGRGVLEALGSDIPLGIEDVAIRGNFCTVDTEGVIVDRRAGRIGTHESAQICQDLNRIKVPHLELSVYPGNEHRFVLVLKGPNASDKISETDPQRTGVKPLHAMALGSEGTRAAEGINMFIKEARKILHPQPKANMLTLRGFSKTPVLPSMADSYRLRPAAIAGYPMYRGLASLIGMQVLATGKTFDQEVSTLENAWPSHDFFYLHYKPADAAGEDGNFDLKVSALQELDKYVPRLLALRPDVLIVTGDHATPSVLGGHSWHPVPLLLNSQWTQGDGVQAFDELNCRNGSIGTIPAESVMFHALAHANKLTKFGP